MKLNNDFNRFNVKFLSLILLIIHVIIFTLWFSWEKDKLREKARKQAILSNDLLGLLKEREQSYLDTLLNNRDIQKSLQNLSMVSQYKTAYLSSLDDEVSHNIFGPGLKEEEVPRLKKMIYKKWLVLGRPFYKNIFISSESGSYMGRYVTDTIEKRNYLLIIQMKNPHFPQILNSDSEGFQREIYIFDENNDLMSSLTPLPKAAKDLSDRSSYSERVAGGDLYLSVTNNINQWSTLLVFRNIFKGSILKIFLLTFLITGPLGIIMLLFFRFFSKKFYLSFKHIVDFLENTMEGDPNENMAELIQTKNSYEESLPKLREQFLLNLLKRREQLPEKIIEKYTFNFTRNDYFILGIFPKSLLLMDEFLEYLKTWNGRIDMAPEREMIAVFSAGSPEELSALPDDFLRFIERETGSFSSIRSDIRELNTAYEEALFCLNSSLRSAAHIITPDTLGKISAGLTDTTNIKKKLFNRMKDGGDWTPHFEELMGHFLSPGHSVMTMKIAFIQLLSDILSLDEDTSSHKLSEEAFFRFQNLSTHLEVKEFFKNIIIGLEVKLSEKRKTEDLRFSQRVESYIAERYSDMTFTISTLAEDLGYSISFLEKKFKNTHGVSIKEFLIKTRIANAKLCLERDPELRIKELAWMVGYENSRSFINIFKKYEGLTPGEYKKHLSLQK